MFCAMGLAVAATLAGCKQAADVTALVGGPDCKVVALEVEYDVAIDPESVCAEAYKVEGEEVVAAKAVNPEHVIVILKGCKPEGCEKPECCEKAEGKCEEAKAECCEKAESKCEEAKPECCEKAEGKCEEAKPECCEKAEGKCDKKDAPKIAVPKIAVQQVADIKTVDGKTVKAWSKPVKASEAKPFHGKHGHKHGHHHGEGAKPECDKCE